MSFPTKVTTLFAVLALTAPAFGSPCTDPRIPHFDSPLVAEPTIVLKSPNGLRTVCTGMSAFDYLLACSDHETNTIYLTAPDYLEDMGWKPWEIACLEKHERAHLWHMDGTRWPASHGGRVSR
jgi:hypothetical protein